MGHAHMHDSSDERRDAAGAGGKTSKSTSSKQRGFRQGLQDFALGATVGGVTKTILAPVERVKLLMQTMDSNENVRSGQVKRYEGIMDCISRVKAEQGVAAFWRGNLVNCLRYAPQQGSALAFNDALNKAFPKYDSDKEFLKSLGVRLVSGGTAGALSATLTYPFDYARTRLASDVKKGKGQFDGIADCIVTTVRSQGITGLYTGWSVTVAGAFVYRAGQLGCFKQIQDMNPYKDDKGTLGVVSAFCAVTAARTVVMPFNYPFDTVRRRMMLQSEKPKSERLYTGSVDCFTKIFKNEGVTGMYKGMLPEMFRGVGGSLVIVGYDRIKAIFNL